MTFFKQNAPPPTERYSNLIHSFYSLRFWVRFTLFSIIWVLLTGWQPSSWSVGVVFIIMASSLSLYLAPQQQQTERRQINPTTLFSFFCYFFIQSLRGGWDTAKLALRPKQKLSPGVIKYQIEIVNESHIFTFMQVLSLLPGTVSGHQEGREISIHVLDLNSFNRAEIDNCYAWVSKLLGSTNQPLVDKRDS
jgi:multicomponent Na+:H+ antiporter subunit E